LKLLVFSESDKASLNIAEKLMSLYRFERTDRLYRGKPVYRLELKGEEVLLVSLPGELVEAQYLEKDFKASLVVFLSRHASSSRMSTLSVHVPGNLGAETYGGLPYRVSIAPANAMKAALRKMNELNESKGLGFKVSYEATHHGPSLNLPSMFVEIGSTEREWGNPEAGEVVAEAAMAAVSCDTDYPAALALGGLHYNPKFTSLGLWEDIAPAHIVSKYSLTYVEDPSLLRNCVERTLEKVCMAVVDWKGVPGKLRSELIRRLRNMGLDIVRV